MCVHIDNARGVIPRGGGAPPVTWVAGAAPQPRQGGLLAISNRVAARLQSPVPPAVTSHWLQRC